MIKKMVLKREKIYSGNLILVNAAHPLQNNSIEELSLVNVGASDILLRRDVANILQLVLEKIAARNQIVPVSGYRSFEEQTDIYSDSLRENGETFTRKYVALPNHSEHQTGLAIDLGLNQEKIDFIRPDFPYEGICGAFRQVAPDYGFIERYAKNKETVTGISHEPWHFRYVGHPHAKIMTEKGLSLEEYINFMKNYTASHRFLYKESFGTEVELYYVLADSGMTEIRICEDCISQISGNNVDGFIVTGWRKSNDKR